MGSEMFEFVQMLQMIFLFLCFFYRLKQIHP